MLKINQLPMFVKKLFFIFPQLIYFVSQASCSFSGNATHIEATSTSLGIRECYKALKSWSSAYPSEPPWPTEVFTIYETWIYETIGDVAHGSMYTACDGIPRLNITSRATTQTTSTVTVEKKVVTTSSPYNETQYQEFMKQFPRKPCNWQHWDRDNSTNREICRELLQDKDFKPQFKVPTPDSDMPFNDRRDHYEETCRLVCHMEAGEEVALIYWPPILTSRDICAGNGYGTAKTIAPNSNLPSIVTMDAITFQGQDMYRKTLLREYGDLFSRKETIIYNSSTIRKSILKGPFTFTSPTVYLAHHPINMATWTNKDNYEWSWSISAIRTAGVEPLIPDQVYSVRPRRADAIQIPGLEYAQLIASGKYNPIHSEEVDLRMVTLDFGHLQDPVPASVYYDARSEDCWGSLRQSHCGTITDGEYRPMLAFRDTIWKSIVPDWYDCRRPELVDPPIALVPAYTLAKPQLPQYEPAQIGEHPDLQWDNPTEAVALDRPVSTAKARPGRPIYSAIATATATAKQHNPLDAGGVHSGQDAFAGSSSRPRIFLPGQPQNALYISSGSSWRINSSLFVLSIIGIAVQVLD